MKGSSPTLKGNDNPDQDVIVTHAGKFKTCKYCHKQINLRGLQHHIKEKHMDMIPEYNKFNCHLCEKVFLQKERLKNHLKQVHNENNACPYFCRKCKIRYKESHTCQKAKRTIKPVCDLCCKSFADGTKLNRHLKNIHKVVDTLELR